MSNSDQGVAILVVDDEESLRETFQFFLKDQGYETVCTASAYEEAVNLIREQRFDLIVSDIVLGGQTGIDLLKQVRAMGLQCPVIMITGYPTVETAADSVRLGAFDYISKPVDKETLLKTTRLALRQYQLEQERQRSEAEKEQYRSFLDMIFRSVTDGIVTVDSNLDILEMNPAARLLFKEISPGSSDAKSLISLCGKEILQPLKHNVLETLKSGRESLAQIFEYQAEGKNKKVLSVASTPLKNMPDKAMAAVMVIRDLSPPAPPGSTRRRRFHRFIGESNAMQAVYTMIENVGPVDLTVLVTGESGTGKELAAEALHAESHRKQRPMVKVDCTAIPETLLESELFGHRKGSFTGADRDRMGRILQADGGTLFLDEIGDITAMMQLRLLRFLQEKTFFPVGQDTPVHVDVRVIAATNVNLREKVRAGTFREDLYFRLRVIDVILPSLRERGEDTFLLADHFIEKIAAKIGKNIQGLSTQMREQLRRYPWPGNVRELKHVIERACVLCSEKSILTTNHLPPEIAQYSLQTPAAPPSGAHAPQHPLPTTAFDPPQAAAQVEAELSPSERIVQALRKTGGNKAKAARNLGIDRSTLYRRIKDLQIDLSSLEL
ncbi:MAG: sigma 54-interacting transcriptional regulator [Desulfobulbaceae bacterium]|nr:sigma 54-interacting transcriptional regulator [Desulfobulbaceae bacterium]